MLLDILKDIAADGDGQITTGAQRNLIVKRVNDAAKEIYESTDIEGCLDESVFDIDVNQNQVSFPWHVYQLRGFRWYENRDMISFHDQRNRYNPGGSEIWNYKFREKRRSALQRDITNESVLNFTIPKAEASPIVISIEGPTDRASRLIETLTIPAGSLSVQSIQNFKSPVISISKNRLTDSDITVTDVDNRILGLLPNCLYEVQYLTVQVLDSLLRSLSAVQGIECLFKMSYVPFSDDSSSFFGSSLYDKAIYWKYKEHRSETIESAAPFQAKCGQVLSQIATSNQSNKIAKIGFARTPYFNVFSHAHKRRRY